MQLTELKCPYCGAALQTDTDAGRAVCPYCGGEFLLGDDGARPGVDAERAGYEFEKGRQRALAEQIAQPKKRKTWLWVLGWIVIFPVPLTVLMVRNKKLNLYLRIAIIALGWIAYILLGAFAPDDPQQEKTPEQPTAQSVVCIKSSEV